MHRFGWSRLAAVMIFVTASSCGSFFKQMGAVKAFSECQFRIKEIKNVTLGGTPAGDLMKASALPVMLSQFSAETLMLNFTIVIEVKNPNPVSASMNRVDWILVLDDIEMLRGVITEKVSLPPGPISIADMPMLIELDVKKMFSSRSARSMIKLTASLAGIGEQTTQIKMRVKPTLEIAGVDYELADYLDVSKEFSAESGRELRRNLLAPTPAQP